MCNETWNKNALLKAHPIQIKSFRKIEKKSVCVLGGGGNGNNAIVTN